MQHWTEFLPEAGRQALRLGQQQTYKAAEIKDAQEKLTNLQFEYDDEEKNIHEIVGKDWTEKEIRKAVKEAELANSEE